MNELFQKSKGICSLLSIWVVLGIFLICFSFNSSIANENLFKKVAGKTVIPGTWDWDIENDEIGGEGKTDLLWKHIGKSGRTLVPMNGAKFQVLTLATFGKIDVQYLKRLKLNGNEISDSDNHPVLNPGTIIAMETAEGNFAKLKILGFRKMHDFSFEESKVLTADWKAFALRQPNKKKYHIEIEWVLFRLHG